MDTLALPALKEWAAVAAALLDGRQTVLLRKGGIHEKVFALGYARFVLFPTVAHSHRERVRPEHHDVLDAGARDVSEDGGWFVVRCGIELVDAVAVTDPGGLASIADLHIWTAESVQADRLDFRPKHALAALVVRAFELPEPVRFARLEAYAGCKSWVDLPLGWAPGTGRQVHDDATLRGHAVRVRQAVGAEPAYGTIHGR